jgi:hypothetical protein
MRPSPARVVVDLIGFEGLVLSINWIVLAINRRSQARGAIGQRIAW